MIFVWAPESNYCRFNGSDISLMSRPRDCWWKKRKVLELCDRRRFCKKKRQFSDPKGVLLTNTYGMSANVRQWQRKFCFLVQILKFLLYIRVHCARGVRALFVLPCPSYLLTSDSQVTHKLLTSDSQVTHIYLTSDSQVTHKRLTSYSQETHKWLTSYSQVTHKLLTSTHK